MWRFVQIGRRLSQTLSSHLQRNVEATIHARTLKTVALAHPARRPHRPGKTAEYCRSRTASTLAEAVRSEDPIEIAESSNAPSQLPIVCPGCGALSQTVEPDVPGYYSSKAKRNRRKRKNEQENGESDEDKMFEEAMARLAGTEHEVENLPPVERGLEETQPSEKVRVCDRCHYLVYQSKGTSIVHPSMLSIQSIIESSPHKNNHIYHVLDAADFPMSLIPNLVSALHLPRLRTQNRRSKSNQYARGRLAEVSFIITRSDLLAPMKEQVDRLLPYLQDVLRDALGRTGRNIRLGNIRLVSAKRGWWTPTVKQEIWDRGGAGWFVGKVNVGKSALFEVVFPKGRSDTAKTENLLEARRAMNAPAEEAPVGKETPVVGGDTSLSPMDGLHSDSIEMSQRSVDRADEKKASWHSEDWGHHEGDSSGALNILDSQKSDALAKEALGANQKDALSQLEVDHGKGSQSDARSANDAHIDETTERREESGASTRWEDATFDEDEDASLLPPAQPEVQFPPMPTVSALPGTTASPIRIPFGGGKGELIDLPGVERSMLETFVMPEHRSSLVMKSRIAPEQMSMRPGQSLLIGGMIRITPITDDVQFLAYAFTPLEAHPTSTPKAIAIQTGVSEDGTPYAGNVESISTEDAKLSMRSAGRFKLRWDVTKKRTGSLTSRSAGKRKADSLPFVVYSADILIEGVGWVELTCQVRRYKRTVQSDAFTPVKELFGDSYLNEEKPEVEVFSPEGQFIGVRRPMNAWLLGGPRQVAKHARKSRPRMTISMKRRQEGGRLGSQRKMEDSAAAV